MRILIDTNIIIYREDNSEIDSSISELFNVINENNIKILVHPESLKDINNDTDLERKKVTLSKVDAYAKLETSPNPNLDIVFRNVIHESDKSNDQIDDFLLYSVYKNAVSFLITNDYKLIDKSVKLNLSDRVFNVQEAINFLNAHYSKISIEVAPPVLKKLPLHNLSLEDPFFDSLKSDYSGFTEWYNEKASEGKEAWVFQNEQGQIGAFLLLKEEEEAIIDCDPPLLKKKRIKISTLKVIITGQKIGELFLKIAFEHAIKSNIPEIYLTHFETDNDPLLPLIHNYGFSQVSKKGSGELIFTKSLKPPNEIIDPITISSKYYPSFYDGLNINKFIVPIIQHYHDLLFQGSQHSNPSIFDTYEFKTEANTIQKAYLCHSSIKKIKAGDILLFYLSKSFKSITTLGVVEKVLYDIQNTDDIMTYVGKRTVYNKSEIEKMAQKETLVILFRWHSYFNNRITYDFLIEEQILNGPPQSILQINHDQYNLIKQEGGINNDFTFN